mgnify:CR=1 FL=1
MDIKEALSIIPRSLVSLISLLVATKILGKKQVSELSLFDYCIGISIGNFTAEMILVLDSQLINGVVAILTFGIAGYLISYLTMKNITLRRFLFGTPTVIMKDGKIDYRALKRVNIDINDFLEQARNDGYFDIKEISYAVMEANGKINFLEKDAYKKPTKKDLKLKTVKEHLAANIIIDGNIMEENINQTDHSYEWFVKELKKNGYTSYENILLATYADDCINIYKKNEDMKPSNILE